MKASLFLTATGAMMAMAGPLGKRVMETDWVTVLETVTVTAGEPAATSSVSAAEVFIAPPAPRPERPTTTLVQAPVQPTAPVVVAPAVPTTTSRAPAPVVTTVIVPQQPPVQSSAPVVEAPVVEAPVVEAPAVPNPAPVNTNDYKSVMVDQHNVHRRNHSASDLTWDNTLAEYALATANGCVFAHDMDQGDGGYGQNLATWGSSGDIDDRQIKSGADGITEQWYNGEVNAWQFFGLDNPPASSDLHEWGHFTQVVWKDTKKVGCATVQCPAGSTLSLPSWYTVCNYSPPGNVGGGYGENVLSSLGFKTTSFSA
jgi:uncharacterized protein YkwD